MKRNLILTAILLASTSAQAVDFSDTAQVVQVVPVTVTNTRQICEQTYVPALNTVSQAQDRGVAGSVIGGILGGLAGHQVGGGSGKTVATIAGAIGGGLIGDHIQNDKPKNIIEPNPASGLIAQTTCHQSQEQVPNGYDVSYNYAGKLRYTHLSYMPGNTVTVDAQAR